MITKKKNYLMPTVNILKAEPIYMICGSTTPGPLKREEFDEENETDGGKVEWIGNTPSTSES